MTGTPSRSGGVLALLAVLMTSLGLFAIGRPVVAGPGKAAKSGAAAKTAGKPGNKTAEGEAEDSKESKAKGKAKDADPVAVLIKKLEAEKPEDRREAVRELQKLGEGARAGLVAAYWGEDRALLATVREMIKALGHDDWNVRRRATLVLRDIGLPALGLLAEARESKDVEVAFRAKRLTESIEAAHDKELETRSALRSRILELLGELGGEASLDVLGHGLTRGRVDSRRVAARALARIDARPAERVKLLAGALGDEDPWVMSYAARGLGELKGAAARDALIKAATPPAPVVVADKERTLKPVAKPQNESSAPPEILDPIERRHGLPVGSMPPIPRENAVGATDARAFKRSRAVRALVGHARPTPESEIDKVALAALVKSLSDPAWPVRLEAWQTLRAVMGSAALNGLDAPTSVDSGVALAKSLKERRPGDLAVGDRPAPLPAGVAEITTETLTTFLGKLVGEDGNLLGRSELREAVRREPIVASRAGRDLAALLEDETRRARLGPVLQDILHSHVVSFFELKDRPSWLIGLEPDGTVVLAGPDGPVRYSAERVVRIQLKRSSGKATEAILEGADETEGTDPKSSKADPDEPDRLLLQSGERLTGRLVGLSEGWAEFDWVAGGRLRIATPLITAFSISSPLSDLNAGAVRTLGEVVMSNGSRLFGNVKTVKGDEIAFDLNGRIIPLMRGEAKEVWLPTPPQTAGGTRMRGRFVRLRLADGDRLWGVPFEVAPDSLTIGSETLGPVRVSRERVVELQFSATLGFDSETTIIADYNGNAVVFVDLQGKVTRRLDSVDAPWDAERLQHGHVLVALYRQGAVVELDETGKEIWRVTGFSQPADVDRLPNGHTLVADRGRGRVIELDFQRKVVFQYSGVYCTDVERLPNGHTLIADSSRGRILEVDPFGNVVWQTSGYRSPADIDALGNGRFLITERSNRVVEVDRAGRVYWEKKGLRSPQDADRLANGNTLIAESSANRVIEVAPDGSIVREITGLNYPVEANRR